MVPQQGCGDARRHRRLVVAELAARCAAAVGCGKRGAAKADPDAHDTNGAAAVSCGDALANTAGN